MRFTSRLAPSLQSALMASTFPVLTSSWSNSARGRCWLMSSRIWPIITRNDRDILKLRKRKRVKIECKIVILWIQIRGYWLVSRKLSREGMFCLTLFRMFLTGNFPLFIKLLPFFSFCFFNQSGYLWLHIHNFTTDGNGADRVISTRPISFSG